MSKNIRKNEIKNGLNKIKYLQEEVKQKGLIYKTNKYKFDFLQCDIITSFAVSIFAGKSSTDKGEEDQSNLIENIKELIKNPHQEQRKVKVKIKILMKVHILSIKDEN